MKLLRKSAARAQILSDVLEKAPEVPLEVVPSKDKLKRMVWTARKAEQKKRIKLGDDVGEAACHYEALSALFLPSGLCALDGEPFLLLDTGAGQRDKRMLLFPTPES